MRTGGEGKGEAEGAGEERWGREDARGAREAEASWPAHCESEFDCDHIGMGLDKRRKGLSRSGCKASYRAL